MIDAINMYDIKTHRDGRAPCRTAGIRGDAKSDIQRLVARLALMVMAVCLVTLLPVSALGHSQDVEGFSYLQSDTRVYDNTGDSLTPQQTADLEQRISKLDEIDAHVVVVVRALDATPDETLEQVEALQQAWVAETGTNQDTAIAILINRNPDDPNDARAGIFVGKTFNDGNVPRKEQEAIVSDALIPPLRDGDVNGSLTAALQRLESSIIDGPPQSAFEHWASSVVRSWLPWVGIGLALTGAAGAWLLFQRRQRTSLPDQQPTTSRPGNLTPGLAGALANGSPQASAVPATILDLATRGALTIEPESKGGTFSQPTIQVRLLDRQRVENDIEADLWTKLEEHVDDGVISGKSLKKVAADDKKVREIIKSQMKDEGWLDEDATKNAFGLVAISLVALLLAVFSLIVSIFSDQWLWLPIVGLVALVSLALGALVMASLYSGLSRQGQEAAIPWKAYRAGIKKAAKDDARGLDLNAILPDAVAMNLGSEMSKPLKSLSESGKALNAFTSQQESSSMMMFPYWAAFSNTVSTSSGSGVVSGGGAGGGGGAAGST